MVENFEEGESKYGRIFKVAGPRKCRILHFPSLIDTSKLLFRFSGRCREHVGDEDVRAGQGRLGEARRRGHQA